jgi:hypothetical protein
MVRWSRYNVLNSMVELLEEIEEAVKEMHANHKRRIERKGKKKSSAC